MLVNFYHAEHDYGVENRAAWAGPNKTGAW